jgi:organic radical activating enzyme
MYIIPNKVDFYITNVCNLTCNNCNRFNNYDFKGWQRWGDYESAYRQWSQLVQLTSATIMGGEPFLNPTLKEWVSGLNNLFNIEVQILTNGTRFLQNKDLYQHLLFKSPKTQTKNHIGVSLHNVNDWPWIRDSIYEFLQGKVTELPKGHTGNVWNSDWYFIDSNAVKINVYVSNHFGKSAIFNQRIATGQPRVGFNSNRIQTEYTRFALYNNDINLAHQNCAFAQFKSYHYIRGKLYKCGPVALMPEFDQQHQFNISELDRILLNSYQALDPDNFAEYHKEFFAKLDNPIPQCKFCPTEFDGKIIHPLRKGSNV